LWKTRAENNEACPKMSVLVTVDLQLMYGHSHLIILVDGIRCTIASCVTPMVLEDAGRPGSVQREVNDGAGI